MIAKITKGNRFAGVGRYLYGPGRRDRKTGLEPHINPRAIAGGHVLLDDARTWRPWVADMEWCASQRPEIARPVWHCSLRLAPGEPVLPDAQWATIAREHIEAMGLAEHPWVAVRHGDDHIHLVASRVDGRGRVWSEAYDYRRAMASMRRIEERHGLLRWTPQRKPAELATTTASERESAGRRQVEPERLRLRRAMHAAVDRAHGQGIGAWETQLRERGIMFVATTTADRRVTGYRVSLKGWVDQGKQQIWLKASQVDRRLSWTRVKPALGADQPGADRAPLTPAELAAQAFPGSVRAAAKAARQRAAGEDPPPVRRRGDPDRDPRGRAAPSR